MIRFIIILSLAAFMFSCSQNKGFEIPEWTPYDQSGYLVKNDTNPNPRLRYKLIQSRIKDKNEIWKNIGNQLDGFTEEKYLELKPFILEKSIPELQQNIEKGSLNYKQLTQWYLYRILKFENDPALSLNAVICINPNALEQADFCDKQKNKKKHPVYGMPILLKDNINTADMPTTAGAAVLYNNHTEDAELVKALKSKGAIILGKLNLSEWAYYFCDRCPLGYSAVGGQSLNPYGRMEFETGGSSSGSATSMAANYAAAAVGTETSGSILSPSSQNSIVGLKPTVGNISGKGIVPISRTLDTAGPMTRSVLDNAILYSALSDRHDLSPESIQSIDQDSIKMAYIKSYYYEDSLYRQSIELLKKSGFNLKEITMPDFDYSGFLTLLNLDMREDLPRYLKDHANPELPFESISDIMMYNAKDSVLNMPYGQGRFDAIQADTTSGEEFELLKQELLSRGKAYFENMMQEHGVQVLLSINNYHAGAAAVAFYPCLTVPMGYYEDEEPGNLTFIAASQKEELLLKIAYAYEKLSHHRRLPPAFD